MGRNRILKHGQTSVAKLREKSGANEPRERAIFSSYLPYESTGKSAGFLKTGGNGMVKAPKKIKTVKDKKVAGLNPKPAKTRSRA